MSDVMIGLFGGLVAAAIGAWATLWARRPRRPKLDFVGTDPVTLPLLGSPAAPPQAIGVSVAAVDVPRQGLLTDHPVVDVTLHNSGGAAVVLKRLAVEVLWARRFVVLPDLLPYVDTSGPLAVPPSATYEVTLPAPEEATDARIVLGVSHVIAGGEVDRIQVRLITRFPQNETALHAEPGATFVYLLRVAFRYNADDRRLASRPLGVACPGNTVFLPSEEGLRRKIGRFHTAVNAVRRNIDDELTGRGLTPPDWETDPPRRREDLPRDLAVLDRRPVGDRFWNPRNAVARYLDEAEALCRELADTLTPDMPDGLGEIVAEAHEALSRIPVLRGRFDVVGV